jgi:hypothetical protein
MEEAYQEDSYMQKYDNWLLREGFRNGWRDAEADLRNAK